MKKTTITCDFCGAELAESDPKFILIETLHYMIPDYIADKHFCKKTCLVAFINGKWKVE